MKCYQILKPVEYRIYTGNNISEIEHFVHSPLLHVIAMEEDGTKFIKLGGIVKYGYHELCPMDVVLWHPTGIVQFVPRREFDKEYHIVEEQIV